MTTCRRAARSLAECLRINHHSKTYSIPIRAFASSACSNEVAQAATETVTPTFDPNTVTSIKGERTLMKTGVLPVGSRRRRAAVKTSDNIPFELLPYQCFQEARKVLMEDRQEKLELIKKERLRISNLLAADYSNKPNGEQLKHARLAGMRQHLEYLKIQADINDPLIKKRFEDGESDMTKPIYRYLADRKWRAHQHKLIVQRIDQLGIVPDLLPQFEPTAEVRMAFGKRVVHPGEFIDSRVSEMMPRLNVQVFDKGERLITVIVFDSDVPDLNNDGFTSRIHYMASNIPMSPTDTSLPFSHASKEDQLVHSWIPPFAQKGSPYHRYSVWVLQQESGKLNVEELRQLKREGGNLRWIQPKFKLDPIGVHVFRSIWDEGTAGVMERAGVDGADVEFKRKKIEALKPKQKARGWEARHAGPKYASLRKGRDAHLKRVVKKHTRGRKGGH
ncbi:putative 54S ribosomal protein L35, mitochondrial [Calycina marina]|uniref:Large ribosomal subunit protein mL38 n=1 Tax=Calycina marina TaxID=1763456 RepID=A0A9P7ZBL2_9HELO|nr:putative 54S ribosomal protein L35, mitochondrial [Calycina marina]